MIWRSAIAAIACAGAVAVQPPTFLSALPAPGQPSVTAGRDRGVVDQAWAMVGREDRIEADAPPPCILAEAAPLDMIADAAANAQVVIVNEAHDSPRDRAFVEDVAARLAPLGFKTYAAEGLLRAPDDGAPRLDGDAYTDEPAFGHLLRTVRKLGYAVVAYDGPPPPATGDYIADINAREAARAARLVDRIFQRDRTTKALIHVGYAGNKENAEIAERSFARTREILWLARRLKDILDIDPLTIDQTVYGAARDGVCFTDAGGQAPDRTRDIYVAHPPLAFDRHRATWRRDRGALFADIPARLKRADERVVVEARLAGDPADAVPADRLLVDPGEDIPLLLAPGAYKARAFVDGAWTGDIAMTVRTPAPAAATPPPRHSQKHSRRKTR